MKWLLLSFLFLFAGLSLQAQNYNSAIGLRMGFSVGLTGKTFLDNSKALEGLIHLQSDAIGFTGMVQKHAEAFDIRELQWYYGAGAHLGLFYDDDNRNRPLFGGDAAVIAGLDAILGIEYTIRDIPFVIGADVKPLVNLIGTGEFPRIRYGGAISIRYIL